MLVTGTRADTCGTKHHHRGRGGGMGTACKDTLLEVPSYLPPHCTRKDITTTGGVWRRFAKFCADHLLQEKKEENTECDESLPWLWCPR